MSLLQSHQLDSELTAITAADFKAYKDSMNGYVLENPQQQGIETFEGYRGALEDPRTFRAELDGAQVPVLFPIEYNGWLNPEHIEDTYGVSAEQVLVLHATEKMLCATFDTSRLAEGVSEHFQRGGAIVIDYPTTDEDYLNRANQKVNAGNQSLYIETGTQTYFAGTTRPHNPTEWTEKQRLIADVDPAQRLTEAFKKGRYIPQDVWENTGKLLLESYTALPEDLTRSTFEFIEEAFAKIKDHPCRQGWSPEEYREIATSTDTVTKLTASDGIGNASAVMALGTHLADYPWVNADFYRHRYPEAVDEGRLVYFPTVASNQDKKGIHGIMSLVKPVAAGFASMHNEVVVCFDSCDKNKILLPMLIEKASNATGVNSISFDAIAQQQYGIYLPQS